MEDKLFTVKKTDEAVTQIQIPYKRQKDWEFFVMLTSDVHNDSKHCDRHMFKRHLDHIVKKGGLVIDHGDFFDAMQGRQDRRSAKSSLKDSYKNMYFDDLVKDAHNLLKPYQKHIAAMLKGNHETAIEKHNETSLTERLVYDKLNHEENNQTVAMGYRAWFQFRFLRDGQTKGQTQTVSMLSTHGSGKGAEVTKGTIKTNRRSVIYDADIIASGHIHESWAMELKKAGITQKGNEYLKTQLHLSLPTYKDEFKAEGFMTEKEQAPRPQGCWYLRFFYDTKTDSVKYDYTRYT